VSLISIFNASGRFLWASGSDYIGRRNTYTIFFLAQFGPLPADSAAGRERQLDDVSGQPVCGLHDVRRRVLLPSRRFSRTSSAPKNVGRDSTVALLTAWSAAAVAGPVIITELSNRAKGRARSEG